MYIALAVFAAILALLIVSVSIYTIWSIWYQARHLKGKLKDNVNTVVSSYFMKWTWLDYAILLLFLVGMIFLLTDVIAVMRDAELYPAYHFGYLLSGFVFSALAMLFLFIRFAMTLKLIHSSRSLTEKHHHKPTQTDHSE